MERHMRNLSYRIRGEAEAEICGVLPESVVNRCVSSGIALRRVTAVDGQTLRCLVDERDLETLQSICERCQCELLLVSLRGGSRYRRFLRRRIWLPVTALLCALSLLFSSLFIWDVTIYGNERVSRGEILRALRKAGVSYGSFWPALSTDLLRSQMLESLPEFAWVTVNMNGSRAVVLVRERAEKPEMYSESGSCALCATHTGIVRGVSVLNGRALVQPGQAVQAGETLVSGKLDSLTGPARFVRARGKILAETWYELTAICPPAQRYKGERAGMIRRFALIVGEKRLNIYGKTGKMLDGYDKIRHDYVLGVQGLFALPLRFVCETYVRRLPGEGSADPDAMAARLETCLQAQIDGEITERSFTEWEKDGAQYVTMRARCLENIAEIRMTTQAEETSP